MRQLLTPTFLLLAAALAAPAPGHAQTADSVAVLAAVDAYHTALESGDTAAVRSLLTDDAIIQEGGGIETRAEYVSHHLPADMAFAAAVPGERRSGWSSTCPPAPASTGTAMGTPVPPPCGRPRSGRTGAPPWPARPFTSKGTFR